MTVQTWSYNYILCTRFLDRFFHKFAFLLTEYVNRRTVEAVRKDKLIPNIPTQPVGYEDVMKFMNELGGDEVHEAWKGKLSNITYRYGGVLPNGK